MENYKAFSATVIGESHIRKNIVCQDYSDYIDDENVKIIAVSDGHGDKACFRSDKGSEFAVKSALEGFKELADEIQKGNLDIDEFKIEKRKNEILNQLVTGIVAKWNILIQNHLKDNPVDKEIEEFKANPDNDIDLETLNNYSQGNHLNHIYGATLIGVLIVNNIIIAIHQGDGKCIFLDKNGAFSEPVPWDSRCFMNVTTSLCDEDSISSFRFYVDYIDDENYPAGIFAASDGIEDSYDNNDAMLCFYRLLCINIAEKGGEETLSYLKDTWLSEISKDGSADDMSVGVIVDELSLTSLKDSMIIENEQNILNENIKEIEERKKSMENKKAYLEKNYSSLENEFIKLNDELEVVENKILKLQDDLSENDIKLEGLIKSREIGNKLNNKALDFPVNKYNRNNYANSRNESKLEKIIARYEKKSKDLKLKLEDEEKYLHSLNEMLILKQIQKDKAELEYKEYLEKYTELTNTYNELINKANNLVTN